MKKSFIYFKSNNWKKNGIFIIQSSISGTTINQSIDDFCRRSNYVKQEFLIRAMGFEPLININTDPQVTTQEKILYPLVIDPVIENSNETIMIPITNDYDNNFTDYYFDDMLKGNQITKNSIYNLMNKYRILFYGTNQVLPKLCQKKLFSGFGF